jgi:tetratricopeptide (TPR) repeat protein
MSTLFANSKRLILALFLAVLSGCSLFTPKPEVIDTQAEVLGPIEAELQKTFAEALVMLREEEYAEAEVLLLSITEKFPSYPGPWSNLAIAQSKQEKLQLALESLDKAIKLDDKFCPAISHKGIVLRELGQFQLAKEQYIAALMCNPSDAMAIYNLGVLSDLYLHDAASALSYYQHYLLTQEPEKQDETVKNWVVDLKRRVPVEEQIVVQLPAVKVEAVTGQGEVVSGGEIKSKNATGEEPIASDNLAAKNIADEELASLEDVSAENVSAENVSNKEVGQQVQAEPQLAGEEL